jgi:cytochrome c oxidase subunit IV
VLIINRFFFIDLWHQLWMVLIVISICIFLVEYKSLQK